jgi:hypothetical protein
MNLDIWSFIIGFGIGVVIEIIIFILFLFKYKDELIKEGKDYIQ